MHLELDQNNSKCFPGAMGILTEKHDSLKKGPSVAGDGCDMVVLGEKEKELYLTMLLSVCLVFCRSQLKVHCSAKLCAKM